MDTELHASCTPCVAVVLAGGQGSRFGGDVPKQFADLAGESVLSRSVRVFDSAPGVDGVLVVLPEVWRAHYVRRGLARTFRKVDGIIAGGASRSESVLRAVEYYRARGFQGFMLLHDGARPLLGGEQVAAVVARLATCEVVGSVLPCHDTLYRVEPSGGGFKGIAPRGEHLLAQTPQGFHFSVLDGAFRQWEEEGAPEIFTDEVSMVLHYQPLRRVGWVEGSRANIKITTPGDMALARALLELALGGKG